MPKNLPYKINPSSLLYYRTREGLTQPELSERSGVTQSFISKYENDVVKGISEEDIDSLAKALNCTRLDLQTPASKRLEVARGVYIMQQVEKMLEGGGDGKLDLSNATEVMKLFESVLQIDPNEESEEPIDEHKEILKSTTESGTDIPDEFTGPVVPQE